MGTAAFCILLAFMALESSHARVQYLNISRLAVASNDRSAAEYNVNVFLKTDDEEPISEDTFNEDKQNSDEAIQPPHNELSVDGHDLQKFKNIHVLMKPQNYTHHVTFFSKASFELLCQGALISASWIVTSAACIKRYSETLDGVAIVTSLVQKENVQARDIKRVVLYPDFQFLTNQNDIALVEMKEPVTLQEGVTSVIEVSHEKLRVNPYCGYTAIYNHTMMGMVVDFVPETYCKRDVIPKQKLNYYCAGVDGRQVNLGETSILGSPLVCDGKLVGIKSISTVFSAVSEATEWIDSVMQGTNIANNNDLVQNSVQNLLVLPSVTEKALIKNVTEKVSITNVVTTEEVSTTKNVTEKVSTTNATTEEVSTTYASTTEPESTTNLTVKWWTTEEPISLTPPYFKISL